MAYSFVVIIEMEATAVKHTNTIDITREVYGQIYDWSQLYTISCDVYFDTETYTVKTLSSGATGPGRKIISCVRASDYLAYDDPREYTREEFIEACTIAHGRIKIEPQDMD